MSELLPGPELVDQGVDVGAELLLLRDEHLASTLLCSSSFLTLAISVCGSTGLGWNSSTGTISSSLSMLRPMAALTLVSMMIGRVCPVLRISRAMRRPSSGSSIMTSRMSRSGLDLLELLHAVGAVGRALDLVALTLEDEAAGLDDVRVVVNDQDLGHLRLPLSVSVPPGARLARRAIAARPQSSRATPALGGRRRRGRDGRMR